MQEDPALSAFQSGHRFAADIQNRARGGDRSETVPQGEVHDVTFFGDEPEILPDGKCTYYSPFDLSRAGVPVSAMKGVIFRILLVHLKIVFRDIHKFSSEEH